MKQFLTSRKAKGFTLVELLIVIIIIGILAGMLLLAVGSATDKAEATKIINALRNYKSAALMYYTDHNTWPAGGQSATGHTGWVNSLDRYTDRSMDLNAFAGLDFKDVNGRVLMGLTQAGGSPMADGKVKAKLAAQAQASALMSAGGGVYTTESVVYMPMK